MVIHSSVDHPKLTNVRTQAHFLTHFPQSYYLDQINPFNLPAQVLEKLRGLNEPQVNLAWLLHLVQQGNFDKAKFLWEAIPETLSETHFDYLVKTLKTLKRWDELRRLANHLAHDEKLEVLLALQDGTDIDELTGAQRAYFSIDGLPSELDFASACKNTVLLVADHFSAFQKLQELRKQYELTPEPEQNSFCLSQVYYLGSVIACEQGIKGFARCDIKKTLPKTDFQIVMTKSGLANVRDSQMTLTLKSDINVMIHELMHFSGFEDEYPVYNQKAKWLCNDEGLKAPNLFVGTQEQAPSGWVESSTCRHGRLNAYKPAPKWSKMQFQELPLSEQYRQLWRMKVYQDWLFKEQNLANSTSTIIN